MDNSDREYQQLYLFACARGLLSDVQSLLEKGVAPSTRDKDGRSGAHFAASRGELETLQFLHSKGVDIDIEDKTGRTPLHYAALRDHEATLRYLIEKGAWSDATDATDCTPLHLAARGGAANTAARLIKLGAVASQRNKWHLTPLGEAISRGHAKVCRVFAHSGHASETYLKERVNGGFTLLHIGAGAGRTNAVAWLLSMPGCPSANDSENDEKLTPLHCCMLGGKVNGDVVSALLSAGVDKNARDSKERTALDILETGQRTGLLGKNRVKISAGSLDYIRKQLKSQLKPQLRARTSESSEGSPEPSIPCPGTPTVEDEALAPAARLQAARTPEEVAEVFKSMSSSDRVHRVKLWASLPDTERASLAALPDQAKGILTEIHKGMQQQRVHEAHAALCRDQQFQSDMRDADIRSAVDSVVAEPDLGPQVADKAAQLCLLKMRQLRDVLRQNGGGPIDLSVVLGDSSVPQSLSCELQQKNEQAVETVIALLCGDAEKGSKDNVEATGSNDGSCVRQRRAPAGTEISRASPRPSTDVWEKDRGLESQQVPAWQQALFRVVTQMLLLGVVVAVFWFRGELPHQRRAGLNAASVHV